MNVQWILVQIIVWYSVHCYGLPEIKNEALGINSFTPLRAIIESKTENFGGTIIPALQKLARDFNESVSTIDWNATNNFFEGRMRKRKYKKQEIMMLTKMLMGLKIALLGVVLPLAVLAAKVLSWKAVTLSLLAFMLAKIVFVKNLLMGKSSTPVSPSPPAPIVIQAPAPSHETIWKRHSPRIHLQPEVHVHQGHQPDEHHPHSPSWTWADEGRSSQDLAYQAWLPKPM